MLLQNERENICDICARLVADKLVVATAGNVSVRQGDLVAITPSGLPYDEIRPDLVSVVDFSTGKEVDGPLAPASELGLHLTAMRVTGEKAVVHTHSPAATAVACLDGVTKLPAIHYYICMFGGSDVRVADYAIYGSTELAQNVAKALEGRTAALMSNHGSVVAGSDLDTAYTRAQELEWVCSLYLRTTQSGPAKILSDAQIEAVAMKIRDTGYGQSAPHEDEA
ncbi:class II aldolase/adducin family protein [Cutibacterium sp.]|uniref:class II aldolase/adducin family protein n=1 Tax=Cutibacterium sp. TaxID=1912221 RepID=UPI0026DCEF83|nr:class II aldolase/adducin family protein [Cutibacterium sp.]MDO4411515.1 class II aldolase/adducin family protein [Cutibacterium sp.]